MDESTSHEEVPRWHPKHVVARTLRSVTTSKNKKKIEQLVGGFNPFEKTLVNLDHSPSRGTNQKSLKPPSRQ